MNLTCCHECEKCELSRQCVYTVQLYASVHILSVHVQYTIREALKKL